MKNKKIYILTFFILISAYGLLAQSNTKLWQDLYDNTRTIRQKKNMIISINKVATKDYEKLILNIFQNIFEFPGTKMVLDTLYFEEAVYYLSLMIHKFDIKGVANELKLLYERMSDATYKGEVLNAIGKTGEKNLLPWLNSVLKKMNLDHRLGKFKGQHDTLYGLIKALSYYNDASSFTELFYAAIPNYSDMIRTLAQDTLKNITDDPAPLCDEIITDELDLEMMIKALRYSVKSKSPDEHKIKTCLIALNKSMDEVVVKTEGPFQDNLRNDAALFLGELKAKNPEVIRLLSRKWDYDKGTKSRLTTIESLQKISTDEAAKVLTKRLAFLTGMKLEGSKTGYLEEEGKRIYIAIIRALGEIKSTIGLKDLYQISVSPIFEISIREEARKALEKLEGK